MSVSFEVRLVGLDGEGAGGLESFGFGGEEGSEGFEVGLGDGVFGDDEVAEVGGDEDGERGFEP